MSNILLVTNEESITKDFPNKLILLRETDDLSYCDYEDAPDIVFTDKPDIVIVHEHNEKDKTLNLIKYIKTQIDSVLLLINNYDRNFILSAYDEGIDDYFGINSDASEISIRTVNCIKKDNLKKTLNRYSNYLKAYELLDSSDNYISSKNSENILNIELQTKNYRNGALLLIEPDEEGKASYSSDKMKTALNKSIRNTDIIAHSSGIKTFIMISEGGIAGAAKILDKIKKELNDKISIKAGICEITSNKFDIIEKHAQCALSESLSSGQEFTIYTNNEPEENWLEEPKEKNYKLFKNAFNKKLEKVITPVFYRLQKSWEEKLFNTKIEQYTSDSQSVFRLINPKQTSLLKIVYPGFAKVIVYITHEGLNSPENKEISLSLNEINNKEITHIIEEFIREFKNTIE